MLPYLSAKTCTSTCLEGREGDDRLSVSLCHYLFACCEPWLVYKLLNQYFVISKRFHGLTTTGIQCRLEFATTVNDPHALNNHKTITQGVTQRKKQGMSTLPPPPRSALINTGYLQDRNGDSKINNVESLITTNKNKYFLKLIVILVFVLLTLLLFVVVVDSCTPGGQTIQHSTCPSLSASSLSRASDCSCP